MAAPKGYDKPPQLKHIKGCGDKRAVEADRAAYRLAGYKTRVVKEGTHYQVYIKK